MNYVEPSVLLEEIQTIQVRQRDKSFMVFFLQKNFFIKTLPPQ